MKIKIGNSTFTGTLYNNRTAAEFKSLLPMTIKMIELNRNEKYADLSRDLTTKASDPGTIQAGDLMVYRSSTLVLFYKTFSSSTVIQSLDGLGTLRGLLLQLVQGM